MNCGETRQMLSAYQDEELDSTAAQGVAEHLGQCPGCRESFRELQQVDVLVRELPAVNVSCDFVARVVTRAERWDDLSRASLPNRTVLASLASLVDSLLEFMTPSRDSSTHTLDEFSDFPPLSIGSAYFKILGHAGRGG